MKQIYLSLVVFFCFSTSWGQLCSITVTPTDTIICPGDSVHVVAIANLINSNQAFDFNSATMPAGWSAGGTSQFGELCGPNPTGTPYYWASTSSGVPNITTADFDVSCGGMISFDMRYAIQAGSSPCEGPDELDEGVALQYSTDGGATWTTIYYYVPDGTITTTILTGNTSVATGTTPFTSWNTFTATIPPGAQTTSTRFRWFQPQSSGSCCDNWGLDNIFINATGAPCGETALLSWSNGIGDETEFWITPYSDTSFTCDVYDAISGIYQCTSDPVTIHLYQDVLSYNLPDYAYSYCPTTNPSVEITNIVGAIPPYSVEWTELGSTNTTVNLPTGGAEHDTIIYHVVVKDGCNFTRNDSVILIVNKLLNIDSLVAYDASSCTNNGVVVAYVSGISSVNQQPIHHWHGPGATNPSFTNSSVWTDRSPGWYYYLITDENCTDFDSVEVKLKDAPVADFTATPTIGCVPFDVTLENNSQNATQYFWDFGDGTTNYTTNTNPISHTYSDAATIRLIARDADNCADTAYVNIHVQICGCTDPIALNYNPNAVVDNGSCLLPDPEFVVPNIFTPNGDGDNDFLEFVVLYYSDITFSVQTRWGNTVFTGSGMNPKWDGTINGNPATDGVYFVRYRITSLKGDKVFEGQTPVQLIR